jgi:hypothetical protein
MILYNCNREKSIVQNAQVVTLDIQCTTELQHKDLIIINSRFGLY